MSVAGIKAEIAWTGAGGLGGKQGCGAGAGGGKGRDVAGAGSAAHTLPCRVQAGGMASQVGRVLLVGSRCEPPAHVFLSFRGVLTRAAPGRDRACGPWETPGADVSPSCIAAVQCSHTGVKSLKRSGASEQTGADVGLPLWEAGANRVLEYDSAVQSPGATPAAWVEGSWRHSN